MESMTWKPTDTIGNKYPTSRGIDWEIIIVNNQKERQPQK
jgi:hypothetical protein